MSKKESENKKEEVLERIEETPVCGIIMPISANELYTKEHWAEVKSILSEVINGIGYKPNLVSDADEIGIIHNRIVSNIADNPIVICDVSSKNPNVMFELGLRLAFDKPTIVIKDELTSYTFDTGVIEHLEYPSSLHYHLINNFKENLKAKLLATLEASKDTKYSTFLKHFVIYKKEVKTTEIDTAEFIVKQLDNISNRLSRLEVSNRSSEPTRKPSSIGFSASYILNLCMEFIKDHELPFDEFKALSPSKRLAELLGYFFNFFSPDERTFVPKVVTKVDDLIINSDSIGALQKNVLGSTWQFSA